MGSCVLKPLWVPCVLSRIDKMAAATKRLGEISRSMYFLQSTRRVFFAQQQCSLFSKTSNNSAYVREFKTTWPYIGSLIFGSFVGYQLRNFFNQKEIEEISILSEVHARSDPGNGSLPPSKRFNFIADAVETAAPAVVRIEVTDRRMSGYYMRGHRGPSSLGSGFIVSEDGLVLTNAHVLENATDVTVKLKDGQEFRGELLDLDPVKDLAAIKLKSINGQQIKFPTIKLGSSSLLRPGEWVVAMGSPLMLSNTVTSGIISTVHRGGGELGLPNREMEYIQTDAPINVGNSGGPLVNLDGEVIGINVITVKFAAGISFAIPIDAAKDFLKGIPERRGLKSGGISPRRLGPRQRWYIGISMLSLTPQILEELQRRDSRFEDINGGVFVAEVNFESPAHKSGLKSGDVIVKINNDSIKTSKEVYEFVKKGETLDIEIVRGGQIKHVTISPQVVG
ncbi:serine protease HTRA2, mitochondrial-like [Nematostella vectensis]|uniref:serine protease HTRA2, mitochondrial-like n=1 Tax=Nematostella vectensis TaxID=45351 RepID=UPI0020770441|nr:serine protease HTRA2, mitochondrial-like [Nematostella vectensis]